MITVCFYGDLRQFGTRFKLHVATPAEALRALFTQLDGLAAHMRERHYQVRFGGQDLGEKDIEQGFRLPESGILHIVPRVVGAGKFGQIILGVVLIVVAWWNPLGWAAGGAMIMGTMSAGIGMVLGGVAQLLTKPPSFDLNREGQAASRNTAFSNLANTAAQGKPVPLAYGLVYCGSRVISQGIESRRVDTKNAASPTYPDKKGVSLTLGVQHSVGKPAIAPDGKPYKLDSNNDSVKARNYLTALTAQTTTTTAGGA